MTIQYVVPGQGDFDHLNAVAKRVGLKITQALTARDYVTHSDNEPMMVCVVTPTTLALLARHSNELVNEMPLQLLHVPGLIYSPEWLTAAATLPPETWSAFEERWRKSGTTRLDPRSAASEELVGPSTTADTSSLFQQDGPSDDFDDQAD